MQPKLNADQAKLISTLSLFTLDSYKKVFVISGQAGVGKTFSIKYFLSTLQHANVALVAPTNKAVRQLKESIGYDSSDAIVTFKTIYSLLGLRMEANGAVKTLFDGNKSDAGSFDYIICDEGSMLNDVVLDILLQKTMLTPTKIILIGDEEQLPPVGLERSPIWEKYGIDYELTEVMRHQSDILTFVQSVRGNHTPVFESPGPEVIIPDEDTFLLKIKEDAVAGKFHNGNSKAIAWRNVTVNFLNNYIRDEYLFSKGQKVDAEAPYVIGDRIVVVSPITTPQGVPLAATDDEGIVTAVLVTKNNIFPEYKCFKVVISIESSNANTSISAYIIHPDSLNKLNESLEKLATKKQWGTFWKLKDAFNTINYGFALTAHRSQGSTFSTVYVDAGDIMLNKKPSEMSKCLYVGTSRAAKLLYVFP